MVEAMSVKELKAFLSERGVSLVGLTEKSELLALARTAHEQDAKSGIVRHDASTEVSAPRAFALDRISWEDSHNSFWGARRNPEIAHGE
jgi:hypothetical protein